MPAPPAPDAAVFAGHFSLEATRPTAAEIAALAEIVPPATPIYFSAVPTITRQEIVAAAACIAQSRARAHHSHRGAASCECRGFAGIAVGPARRSRRAAAAVDRWRRRRARGFLRRARGYPERAACARPASRRSASAPIRKVIRAFRPGVWNPHSTKKSPPQLHKACASTSSASSRFSPERILAWLKTVARLRHRQAGEDRHGGADQRAGAAALCEALRRGRFLARAGVGRRQRSGRQCRP